MIQFCQDLKEKDFTIKTENLSRKKTGKREYLNDKETIRMMKELEKFFESKVDIPLIRHGKKQRIERLIMEEALLLAKFLRHEKTSWVPRIARAYRK